MSAQNLTQEQLNTLIGELLNSLLNNAPLNNYNIAMSAVLSNLANLQPTQQPPQMILPIFNIGQPNSFGQGPAPNWLSFAATPSTYGLPALGSFGTFVPPLFSPFVGFRTKFDEAVAHAGVCRIYTQREVMDTKYNYIFNPSGSPHLPQLVEKSSPTTRTLFKRWMEKHGCNAGDIDQRWEHMDETARRGWEDLARWLRRERKNQLEKKYITVNRVNF